MINPTPEALGAWAAVCVAIVTAILGLRVRNSKTKLTESKDKIEGHGLSISQHELEKRFVELQREREDANARADRYLAELRGLLEQRMSDFERMGRQEAENTSLRKQVEDLSRRLDRSERQLADLVRLMRSLGPEARRALRDSGWSDLPDT